jgi:hypothetical protein
MHQGFYVVPPPPEEIKDDHGQPMACDACARLYWPEERKPGDWCNRYLDSGLECDGMTRLRDGWHDVPLRSFELESADRLGRVLLASESLSVGSDGEINGSLLESRLSVARDFLLRLVAEVRKARGS